MRIPTLLLLTMAAPAAAQDYVGFQSPTGNIHCALYLTGSGAEARCDLRELKPSFPNRPAWCELDWGSAFAVGTQGPAAPACVGDTVMDPGNPVLPYGEAVSMGGISCVSAKTGMTCTNGEGHGFSVARSGQQLF